MNPDSIDHDHLVKLLKKTGNEEWHHIPRTSTRSGAWQIPPSMEDACVALRNAAPALIQRSRLLDKVTAAINNPLFDDRDPSLRAYLRELLEDTA